MIDIVEKIEQKLVALDEQLVDPEIMSNNARLIELNRERRHLDNIVKVGSTYRDLIVGINEAREIIEANEDADLVAMAKEELEDFETRLPEIERELKLLLLPRDPDDDKPAFVEIRAGTGGDEAGIFAGDLFRMYQRYADTRGWKLEIMNSSPAGMGGFKEVIFSLSGDGVYGVVKYESGVHRVQRVPATESQGRVHTSAVTVAVFPEAQEVDISIAENEVKVDVYRSSGPGGQSVNTTDSAVRLTHLPTGLVVMCQDEKSQIKNRTKAMKVLRARLYDQKMAAQQEKIAAERRSMVSTGDRSAKIRTYNFPQSRVTDHRINLTLYKLDEVMKGDLDELIIAIRQHDQEKRLQLQSEDA
ncbi:MAG: peptide chain release factor 1 [bacterium]|nr:peptide chain release factor 1 [bacterium]